MPDKTGPTLCARCKTRPAEVFFCETPYCLPCDDDRERAANAPPPPGPPAPPAPPRAPRFW